MRAIGRRRIPNRYHGAAVGQRRRSLLRRAWPIAVLTALSALAGTVLALSVETADWVAESTWLRVRGVEVRGQRLLTAANVLDWMGAVEGQPLIEVSPMNLAERLRAHPRIADARVARGVDRRLHVVVEERHPCALVLAGTLVEVDQSGVVLPPLQDGVLADRPVIVGVTDRVLVPGEELSDPALLRTLSLLAELEHADPTLSMRIAEIDLSDDPMLFMRLTGGGFTLRTHVESITAAKLDGLHAVLQDLERRGRRDVEIDLRFEGRFVIRSADS